MTFASQPHRPHITNLWPACLQNPRIRLGERAPFELDTELDPRTIFGLLDLQLSLDLIGHRDTAIDPIRDVLASFQLRRYPVQLGRQIRTRQHPVIFMNLHMRHTSKLPHRSHPAEETKYLQMKVGGHYIYRDATRVETQFSSRR